MYIPGSIRTLRVRLGPCVWDERSGCTPKEVQNGGQGRLIKPHGPSETLALSLLGARASRRVGPKEPDRVCGRGGEHFSVYVRCAERPQLGNWVRASIEWPVLLNGKISLQLICNGVVARVDDHGFAFEFHRHEFRTKRTISIAEGRVWQAEPEQIAKMA
jgi:hypothetical protein